MSLFRRYLPFATLAFAIAAFYLYQLDGVGVLEPDEPRYLAIGQAMARTGDLITPRLWGSPWFEKPPLLYWMTAAGTVLGLGPEMAGRLPVALLSLAFLAVAFQLLRREFGLEAAAVSMALLSTSAGWVAYSQLSLTDVPMAVFFSLAVFLALPLLRELPPADQTRRRFLWIGACLGLATLAKGLVPLVLFIPSAWFLRRWRRHWWLAVLACALVAGPWYVSVYVVNGNPFLEDFFWKQHFERIYSAALQHVQPWYFYIPVLLGGLFPWTPLFALPARRGPARERRRWDTRRLFLLAVACFGFLFFSIPLNKLPGYLIPLLPPLFALLGSQFERRRIAELGRGWLLAPALLIACIPVIAHGLPGALGAGRVSAFRLSGISATELFYVAAPIAVWLLARRSWRVPLLILSVAAGGIYLKVTAYPAIDQTVSARALWKEIQPRSASICDAGINRDWLYGLNFYRGVSIPPCGSGNFDFALRARGRGRPELMSRKEPPK